MGRAILVAMRGGGSSATGSPRVSALDGLRGLAVAAVLLFHSELHFARGGYLGVSAFFTLSGFLITSLLLARYRDPNNSRLRSFWARRARRLLPASALTLFGVVLFGVTVATADQLRMLRGDVLATIAYVANWRFYFSGQSYAQLFRAPSPVLHFWSLAIEEQFYLVFPLLVATVMWATRHRSDLRRRQVLGVLLTVGILASVIAGRVLYPRDGSARVYYGTDTRAAELLIGALLAVVLAGRVSSDRPVSTRTRVVASAAGFGALALMVWWWATVDQSAAWLYRGGFALHACCAAVVIAAARVKGPFSRALSWRPLAALGVVSYGVYLFHWPIFLWLTADRTGLATAPLLVLRLAVTIPLAVLSFRLIEQPILRGERMRRPQIRFVIPATAIALVTLLILTTASPPAPTIVYAALSAKPSALQTRKLQASAARFVKPAPPPPPKKTPLYRPFSDHRPLRIFVVGDSVGQTLGRGLELWAYETGGAVVENEATPMCSLGRLLPRKLPLGEVETPSEGCAGWAPRWGQTISSFDPDVVVVLFSIWESEARELPGGRFARPGDPELDRWQLSEYQAAADELSARGAPLLWLDIACEDSPIKPEDPFWYVDYRTLPELARSRPAVHTVDMNHLLCPHGASQPDFGGVRDVRPDNAHFSDAGALAVAKWMMPIVLGQVPAPRRIFEQYRRPLSRSRTRA